MRGRSLLLLAVLGWASARPTAEVTTIFRTRKGPAEACSGTGPSESDPCVFCKCFSDMRCIAVTARCDWDRSRQQYEERGCRAVSSAGVCCPRVVCPGDRAGQPSGQGDAAAASGGGFRGESAVSTPTPAVTTPRSAVTTPTPAVTTPRSAVTTPTSAVTTPRSAVTTPRSAVTTLAPAVTTPRSAVTTPRSAVTTPAPAVTTPRSAVTTPAPAAITTNEAAVVTINELTDVTTNEPAVVTTNEAADVTANEPAVVTTSESEVLSTHKPAVEVTQESAFEITTEPAVETATASVVTKANAITTESELAKAESEVAKEELAVATTEPRATTTEPPAATKPAVSTDYTATTTETPATITETTVPTTEPPNTTTEPPATATDPPATTTEPPATTTKTPVTTQVSSATTAEAPVVNTAESVLTTTRPATDSTTQSEVGTEGSSMIKEKGYGELETSSATDESSAGVDGSSAGMDESSTGVDESSTGVEESSAGVNDSSTGVDESSTDVEENYSNVKDNYSNVGDNYTGAAESSMVTGEGPTDTDEDFIYLVEGSGYFESPSEVTASITLHHSDIVDSPSPETDSSSGEIYSRSLFNPETNSINPEKKSPSTDPSVPGFVTDSSSPIIIETDSYVRSNPDVGSLSSSYSRGTKTPSLEAGSSIQMTGLPNPSPEDSPDIPNLWTDSDSFSNSFDPRSPTFDIVLPSFESGSTSHQIDSSFMPELHTGGTSEADIKRISEGGPSTEQEHLNLTFSPTSSPTKEPTESKNITSDVVEALGPATLLSPSVGGDTEATDADHDAALPPNESAELGSGQEPDYGVPDDEVDAFIPVLVHDSAVPEFAASLSELDSDAPELGLGDAQLAVVSLVAEDV